MKAKTRKQNMIECGEKNVTTSLWPIIVNDLLILCLMAAFNCPIYNIHASIFSFFLFVLRLFVDVMSCDILDKQQ